MEEWVNWSGSLRFKPAVIHTPANEDELKEIVKSAENSGQKIRLAAAGHSSSPLVQTGDVLINLKHFKGIVAQDRERQTVTLRAGMTIEEVSAALKKMGLAIFNTGDVDVQTLAGAISTGTHGSGRRLPNLASVLHGVRMIDSGGNVRTFNDVGNPDVMRAMRVSLGAFGIFSEITVRVIPLIRLKRIEICTDTNTCLENFDRLAEENRNMDFYWYPRSDEIKIRILNEPGQGTTKFDFKHTCRKVEEGWIGDALPRDRTLKFEEIEYAFPADDGLACFREVRDRIREKHRRDVAWRVLVRTIASDDNYLSPHHGRDSVSISVHHNAGLPFEVFFRDMEEIFVRFGGRPHWAKKHFLKGAQIAALYPEWNTFQALRRRLDPQGVFLNGYLSDLFDPGD